MTAFDDILNAEQEAGNSIASAKEEVVKAVAEARGERKTRLEAETARLNEIEEVALSKHENQIAEQTKKIKAEVDSQVLSIEKKFESHKAELQKTLKSKFAK